jgi:hypothetical protein
MVQQRITPDNARKSYLFHIHHDKTLNLWILLFIEATIRERHGRGCVRVRGVEDQDDL